jgi:prepilin-type N-terminal cleavage/methylation domain-containing protein
MHHNARTRHAGARSYTLIELIMVLAVLGLAAAILIPNMVGTDSLTTQAAVRLLIADLSFAQSDALANQEFRRVVFYDDGAGYCIINVPDQNFITPADLDAYTDYVYDPLGNMGRYIVNFTTDNRFAGVVVSDANIDGVALEDRPEITYDQLGGTVVAGGIPGTGGNIDIAYNDISYRITVAPFTGKLTVTEM